MRKPVLAFLLVRRTTRTSLTVIARDLRTGSTDAERHLWYHLRDRRFFGYKFRRQFPVDRYVVDFVCLDRKLVVELDGGQHSETAQEDARRTAQLVASGFRVVRFWNDDVLRGTEAVLQRILWALRRDGPSP